MLHPRRVRPRGRPVHTARERVELQEERADAGRALHEAGLRDEVLRLRAILRLHPSQAVSVVFGGAVNSSGREPVMTAFEYLCLRSTVLCFASSVRPRGM